METITARKREILGKKVRSLRKEGILPAVVYGRGKTTESIAVSEKDFGKVWKAAGESTIINLELEGGLPARSASEARRAGQADLPAQAGKKGVLIHGVDLDPLTDKPRHIDFYEVDMSRKVEVDVPIEFIGESEAIKTGGVLVKVMHELRVEALPGNLPPHFEINLALLKNIGDAVHVSDVKAPEGVKILANPEDTIVFAEEPRKEEEEAPAEEASLEDIERVGEKEKKEGEEAEEGENLPAGKAGKKEEGK